MQQPGMIPSERGYGQDVDHGSLVCPVCAFECVHIRSVMVDQGESIVTVDRDGSHPVRRLPTSVSRRGSVVSISFWCESGHQFTQVFSFHKGTTSVQVDIGETVDDEDMESLRELWRD